MNHPPSIHVSPARHRAEDDLFHFDRSRSPKATECDTGLFNSRTCARYWVIAARPRWLMGGPQPLLRTRFEG